MRLERIEPTDHEWRFLDDLPGRVLFQTRAWLEFVARSQRAEPVVAALLRRDEIVGYFAGLVVTRYGLRILGSPFPGWTTPTMGFTLTGDVSRRDAAAALPAFAFRELGCVHLELTDRDLAEGDLDGLGFESRVWHTFERHLGSDDEIFAGYTSACRRAVRKAVKVGVVVEEAGGAAFADEYHEQLRGVFARQSLVPTYGVDRVRELITALEPTGRLMLLRARAPDGRCIATGIFPGFGGTAYFWGGASVRAQQILRPNEALFWYAMRRWRDRGAIRLDFGGGGDYKRRYGGTETWIPSFRRSRFPGLGKMRDTARTLTGYRLRWRGRLAGSAARAREAGQSLQIGQN